MLYIKSRYQDTHMFHHIFLSQSGICSASIPFSSLASGAKLGPFAGNWSDGAAYSRGRPLWKIGVWYLVKDMGGKVFDRLCVCFAVVFGHFCQGRCCPLPCCHVGPSKAQVGLGQLAYASWQVAGFALNLFFVLFIPLEARPKPPAIYHVR